MISNKMAYYGAYGYGYPFGGCGLYGAGFGLWGPYGYGGCGLYGGYGRPYYGGYGYRRRY